MSAARVLLAEAMAQGVTLYRVGDRVRYRADRPPPADLLERLRRHREELRVVVPEAAPTAAPPAQNGTAGCIDCRADLGPGVAGLCVPCRQHRNPAATPVDALRPEAWQAAPEHPVCVFRVFLEAFSPPAALVELRPGVTVQPADARRAVWSMLGDLIAAGEIYAETCADGGDRRRLRRATEAAAEIERLVDALAKLGARVRVVGVQ